MVTFIGLYRGSSVADAELVTVSANKRLVADFARELLRQSPNASRDPILSIQHRGERQALELIAKEAD